MRKVLISTILAATTLAIAAPAAAQFTVSVGTQYGSPYGNQYGGQYGNYYGSQYGSQYGNAYGYNNYGQTRSLMLRINQIEQQINILDRRNVLSDREANQLRYQANVIERQLRQASYNGLNGYERRNIEYGIARLEQNIRYQANDGNRYGNNAYGSNYGRVDRDGDGRDDRAEHQRYHDQHDGNRDDDDDD